MAGQGNVNAGNGSSVTPGPRALAIVVAVIVLAAYGLIVWSMWRSTGTPEPDWSRKVVLLTGIEAIAFAAAGWLFGREVNRGAADMAKDAQDKAQRKSEKAGEERGKGKSLAAAIRATSAEPAFRSADESQSVEGSQVSTLVRLADDLYPPEADS